MDEERLKVLLRKFIKRTLSEEERREFMFLVAEPEAISVMQSFGIPEYELVELKEEASNRILEEILASKSNLRQIPEKRPVFKPKLKLFAAAAILCFVLLGSYVFFFRPNEKPQMASGNVLIKDAAPGQNGAILTLSNGQTFLMDTTSNTTLVKGIVHSKNGLSLSGESSVPFAKLETALGRQQRLRLSDGTIAWLNAGSSIRFPTSFKGNCRVVEVTGEVYFEVVHNEHKPFMVKVGKEVIHDLGTHFDVNAYGDGHGVKTTLLEGSVQIGKKVLKPGEQYENGNIKKVNADATVAWVSGFFQFENTDIKTAMNQLSRWYNVEIKYEGTIPSQVFEGEIQRSLTLSQVLNLLTGTGIHYTLDGNKLTIRP